MNRILRALSATALLLSGAAAAQTAAGEGALSGRSPVPAAGVVTLPADTLIQVTTGEEITSMKMKEGDVHVMMVATDVSEHGTVVIPRGAPVMATVTWRTGKGIGGKSAKFEVTFNSVTVHGTKYALKGKYRAEGRGNTAAALLGSMIITGRSATITAGQVINAFTADSIPAV